MSVKARSGKTTPTTNLPPWRQIRWALVFLFVALTAVPLIAVQAINIIEGSQNARQMVFSQLESVAELKIDQIDRWIAANDIALDIIGAALNDPLVALAESPDEDASQALQQRMAELIVPDEEGETPLLTELFFYTTDGVIRAASSESQVGKIVTQQPYYAPSLSEETLTDPYIQPPFYDVATGDLTMIFTYPITNEAGELVGVLAAKPEVGFLGEVMTQRTGLGETGETYLVSLESHYLLTPSHFEGYPLRRAYHSEGIDRALEGESGSGLYEGYRGTRVFGVYRWLPELQAALIAEEEQAEAFAPFREVTATTASLTGLAVLVAAALGSIAAIELSRPINALTEAAVRIAGGDFSKRAKVRARNEIGVLADTFNMMAERIQDLVTTLEERVAARTRDLEVAVEVSRQVSTILDLDRLLTEFVELTKESFNLYHVHVYLLDETGRTLAVQAGSGEAGRILKQRGHHIPLNTEHSLVARAARLLEPVVINDVTQEPDFLPNPLLPKTRSEMAIPLAVGDQLVGVLDVQADEPNHFEKEDVQALMVLAGQVAVAVQNASTFTERERVQAERERIRRRQELAYELGRQLTTLLDPEALLRETVNRLSEAFEYYHAHVYLLDEEEQKLVVAEGLGEAGRIMKEGGHSIALDVERSLVARAARSRQPIVVNDVTGDPDHLPNPLLPETRAEVAVPLIFGERVLGVLDVQSRLTGHFDEDEVRTLQIIANQLAVALSNARLFRETESALLQVEGLYQAGQALIAAQDMEEMLRAFAMPLWSKGKCDATLFQVGPDGSKSPEWVEVVAYASETGTPPAPVGQRFPVPNLSPFSKLAENPDHILLIPDVMESEHLDEEMARRFLRINIRSLVLVPLVVADEWEGVVAFSWPEPHTLSEEDVQLYNALTPQMATLVHNQHLFREVEQSERLLRSIIDSTQDWIFVKDRDFRYVLVNRAFAEFYGQRSPEEMIGKDDYDLGTPAYLIEGDPERGIRGFRTDDRAVIEEGKTIHNPFDVVLWPDGSEHIMDTQRMPLYDAEGNIIGVLGVARDVTERERIRRRQELAYGLGQQLTTLLDPDELLRETVNRLSAVFDYYHAHIYLLDEEGQELVVAEGLGEAGRIMKEGRHSIALDAERSLVARAARSRQPIVVNDVTGDPDHLPNPLLPETRAEAAVPLVFGDRLFGVLDVQSSRAGHFDEDEVRTLQIVAGQLAIALSNARLFRETEQSERLLRAVIDSTQDWIFSKDRSYRFMLVNRAFAEFYGQRSPEEMIGKDDYDMGTPAYLIEGDPERGIRGFRTDDRAVIEEGKTIHNPFDVVLWPDGSEHILDTQKTPLYDAEGNIIGVLGVARDVTERERIRRRQELAHDLAQQLTTLLDPDELLRETVNRLSEAFEYYHAHIYLLDEEEQKLVVAEGLGEAGRIMKESGHSIPVELERSLVARAARSRQPVVVNDVTKDPDHLPNPLLPETRAEVAIPLVLGDQLLGVLDVQSSQVGHFDEDEVRTLQIVANQLAVALSNARLYQEQLETAEQLRELDKLKSEFLANMSHELRTPLNSIIGYSELLIDDLGDQLDEMSLEDLQAIHASGHHLLALINDILDLAKIEAGRMELSITDIDLGEFIPPLVDMSRVLLKDKPDVELQLDIPETLPTVKADPVRLRQILWNLLSNAIKFTDEGYVKLTAQADDGWMYISVEDTGIGIPKEYHEVIFDQFRQMDGSATRREGGTGLGLTITRQLVYMHGGDLQLESEPGQGSTFTVKLPLVAAVDQRSDGRGREISGNGARATGRQESQTTETPGD